MWSEGGLIGEEAGGDTKCLTKYTSIKNIYGISYAYIHIFLSESRDDNIKMKSSKLYEARVTFYLFFTCDDRFIKNIIIFLRLYY